MTAAPRRLILLAVFGVALALRLLHNGAAMTSPLYDVPVGGHAPALDLAERIAEGDWLPFDGPISLNDPLYPYLLALQYRVFGTGQLRWARLAGVLTDSFTCVLIALVAQQHFGALASAVAGFVAAAYAPLISYAVEPMALTYALFFVTLGILIGGPSARMRSMAASGVSIGIATALRPEQLLLAVLLAVTPLIGRESRAPSRAAAFAFGVLLGLAPLPLVNHLASGQWTLLTVSGGHNFYLGHRHGAGAGYTLPDAFDGDIFASMKAVAERVEGRPFGDREVSPYYVRKALRHVAEHPVEELKLVLAKLGAALNDHEATTYTNFYFQQEFSPVLRHGISFGVLFPLAVVGMVAYRRHLVLLMPVWSALATIVLFFYIDRLRMPAVPSLAVLAGGTVSAMYGWWWGRSWAKLAAGMMLVAAAAAISNRPLVTPDLSNEWNKAGVVLRLRGRYAEAEEAFLKARSENPSNPHSYLNLAVLYTQLGDDARAAEMRRRGEQLRNRAVEESFIRSLEEQ
jgi:hypothetical protein